MAYVTRSFSAYSLRSRKIFRTPINVIKRRNHCDVTYDVYKNEQMGKLVNHLHLLNKNNNELKALVLDSKICRTSKMLKRHNICDITLVERNKQVALKHRTTSFSVEETTVTNYLKTTSKKYDILYLDTESGSPDALCMLNTVLQGNVIANKCLLFLNFSSRGKLSFDSMELLDREKGGLTMDEFWNHCSTFVENSNINVTLLYKGKYNRDRGAPMYYFALLLEK